jgi:hypothetical protein
VTARQPGLADPPSERPEAPRGEEQERVGGDHDAADLHGEAGVHGGDQRAGHQAAQRPAGASPVAITSSS